MFVIALVCATAAVVVESFNKFHIITSSIQQPLCKEKISVPLLMARVKFDRESLGDKDVFAEDDDDDDESDASSRTISAKLAEAEVWSPRGKKKEKKRKFRLEPETVFFEGPPSPTEIVLPAISILTVIGIIPFIAAVARQIWVRYKFTSRRISIKSGIGGQTQTEIIYPDVQEIRYAFRGFGASGDMVLFLKDGAKVELRHVPQFKEVYDFVLGKCDEECRQKSMKIT